MKISLKWLNDYVDVSDYFTKPQELGDLLTNAGLEVEYIQDMSKQFESVVIGCIMEKAQHPDADKLSVCQVSTGQGIVHQIVCGAKNHKADDFVVVALPGASLPNGMEIKQAKLRGVESSGMLCSEKELGLSEESSGIMILQKDVTVGQKFSDYAQLDDVVFELKVTPNRADCLSHFGLARELSCLLDRALKHPQKDIPLSDKSTMDEVGLNVKADDLCPRYAGRFVAGVKVGPSPSWLRRRLENVGINSINNVVDVTNYVMLELGQPLHAFDVAQIQGRKIIVDMAKKKEKFTTLDGTDIELEGNELMIRDGERPVALAGVVGGKNSGVSESTSDVFIESAYFVPATVRKTSRKFGIETDSGYRFSRGVDPEGTVQALDRATELMLEVAGGTAYSGHYDNYPNPVRHNPISISLETINERLGYEIEDKTFKNWMQRLGCEITESGELYKVTPPPYRWDLTMDVDLIEEVARLQGYDHIPETLPPMVSEPTSDDFSYLGLEKVNDLCAEQGFRQAVNYSFVSSKGQSEFLGESQSLGEVGLNLASEPVGILNPLNEDLDVMRTALLPGLFENLMHNYRHGNEDGRLFETGPTFSKSTNSYVQEGRLAFMAWGKSQNLWTMSEGTPIVFELKTAIENILRGLNITSWRWDSWETDKVPSFFHPAQVAKLWVEGKHLGAIGTLHPKLKQKNKLRTDVAMAELNLDRLLQGQPRIRRVEKVSKFPMVQRDLAFVLKKDQKAGDVAQALAEEAKDVIQSVDVFDVYEGENLPAGQKSVAFRLTYQDQKGTMSEEALADLQNQLIKSVSEKFSASVR